MSEGEFTVDAGLGEPAAVRGAIGAVPDATPAVEAHEIARALPDVREGADLYAAFAAAGLAYGPAFRLVRSVRHDRDTAVGELAAPPNPDGLTVHPALLDAALQTAAVLVSDAGGPWLPFVADQIDVLAPVSGPARSVVRRRGGMFDVDLVDLDDVVCVRVRGLLLRPHRDPLAGLVRVPQWREAPTPGAAPRHGKTVVLHPADLADTADTLARVLPDARLACPGERFDLDCDALYVVADAAGAPRLDGRSRNAEALFPVLRDLARARRGGRPLSLRVVTSGAVALPGDPDGPDPDQAALLGLLGSVAGEWPDWSVSVLDFDVFDAVRAVAEPGADRVVAWRSGRRHVRVFHPVAAGPGQPFRAGGVYLVVGGAGGIGRALTRHLLRTASARVAWLGRSADVEVPRGVEYLRADVTDPAAVAAAVASVRDRLGPIAGVFHAAMVLRDRTVANLDDDTFREVMAPKAASTAALFQAVRDEPLDFLVFFSSAAAVVDSPGQSAYAAGSAYQDAYALAVRADFPVLSVDWGYWGSVGAVADAEHRARLAALGVGSVEPAEGLAALDALLTARVPQALVVRASPGWWARLDAPEAYGQRRPVVADARRTARDYVRAVFAEVLRHRAEDLDDDVTFDEFGVDSLISQQIVTRLERDLGDLPATLLFQRQTIAALADHLTRERPDKVAAVLATPGTAGATSPGSSPRGGSAPGAAPATTVVGAASGGAVSSPAPEGIAVIGVSGRYPGAPDVRAFWRNLAAGVVSVTEVPRERWDWRPTYDPRPGTPQRSPSLWGAFLEDVDRFDPAFFSVLAREAAFLDPQERLFLETAWNLLEETGYLGEHTREPATGVFVGVMYGTYGQLGATRWHSGELAGAHSSR